MTVACFATGIMLTLLPITLRNSSSTWHVFGGDISYSTHVDYWLRLTVEIYC